MPSLGFLKKKKTKDSSNNDPNSPTKASNLSSLVSSPVQQTFPANSNAAAPSQPTQAQASSAQATNPVAVNSSKTTISNNQPGNSQSIPTNSNELPTTAQNPPASVASPMSGAQSPAQSTQNVPSIQSMLNSNMPGTTQQQEIPRETKGKYTLTDFAIQRTLGTGSFGRVHLVQSKHNQRFYAVKVLKKAQVVKMKQIEHTNDERKMLQRVKHPFLITLWGTFQDSKNLYMVMDFIEGGELFSLLRKSQVGKSQSRG